MLVPTRTLVHLYLHASVYLFVAEHLLSACCVPGPRLARGAAENNSIMVCTSLNSLLPHPPPLSLANPRSHKTIQTSWVRAELMAPQNLGFGLT